MNSRTLSTLAIAGFVLLGAICIGLRYRAIQKAEIAREETLWELTYAVRFGTNITQGQDFAKLDLALPFDTRYCTVLSPNRVTWTIPNPTLRAEVRGPFALSGNRQLWLTTEQARTIYDASASSVLRLSPRPGVEPPLENLTSDARSVFTRKVDDVLPVFDDVVRKRAQDLTGDAESPAERIQRVFEYCKDIATTSDTPNDDVVQVITNRNASPLGRARTMVTLCRSLRLPARLVTGFLIAQGTNVEPHVWVEVFQSQTWVPYDPSEGWSLTLPPHYVPVARNTDRVYEAVGIDSTNFSLSFSIRSQRRDPQILKREIPHPKQIFNLKRLPVPMHQVMTILLLLPFAALITAILRNVVGLQTFGTFSPALLAMSFIYADLATGLAILAIVVAVGLVGRSFLEWLRLLMVPRLSIILTMVILCVVFGVSILHYMVPGISAEVVLLPMVIMTMLIERFHVTAEEDGMVYTLQLAAGTLLVAILCYLVLRWDKVGELVLTYPEIHFFTIAAFIFLGRYAGYRMTELWRFKDLVGPSETGR